MINGNESDINRVWRQESTSSLDPVNENARA